MSTRTYRPPTVKAMQQGATMLGLTLAEYRAHVEAAEKWCCACRVWHPVAEMAARTASATGLDNVCKRVSNQRALARMRRLRGGPA